MTPDSKFRTVEIPGTAIQRRDLATGHVTTAKPARKVAFIKGLDDLLIADIKRVEKHHPGIVKQLARTGLDVNVGFDNTGLKMNTGKIQPWEVGALSPIFGESRVDGQSAYGSIPFVLANSATHSPRLVMLVFVQRCCNKIHFYNILTRPIDQ